MKKNFITDICNDYNILPKYVGEDIEWLDLPNDQMPNYEYKEFDWPSSKVSEIKNNKKPKYLVNESADTVAALNHLLEQISLFLKNKSLDSMFLKIKDASSDKSCNVNLNGFGSGRTDLIISSIYSDSELLLNYCSIQLKPIIITKHEGSDDILKSSSAQDNTLSPQSFAELLAYTCISECPIMHCTTDLNQNFHIIFLLEIDNRITLNRYKLSAKKAIASIAIWLYYFCPHLTKNKNFKPKTQDLNLLASIQRAHQLIKKKLNSFDLWKLELTKLDEESEDSNSKCQKWVEFIN